MCLLRSKSDYTLLPTLVDLDGTWTGAPANNVNDAREEVSGEHWERNLFLGAVVCILGYVSRTLYRSRGVRRKTGGEGRGDGVSRAAPQAQ